MSSPILKLAQGERKDPKRCKKIDAIRLKKYISCFIYQSRDLPINEFVRKIKAPVEHILNSHDFYDPEWFWEKQLDDKQLELTAAHMKQKYDESAHSESQSESSSHFSWSTCSSSVQAFDDEIDDGSNGDVSWKETDHTDSDSEVEEEEDIGLDEEENNKCKFFLEYSKMYNFDQLLFKVDDLQEMKLREKTINERTERGYYRSKIVHEDLYSQTLTEYSPLCHPSHATSTKSSVEHSE